MGCAKTSFVAQEGLKGLQEVSIAFRFRWEHTSSKTRAEPGFSAVTLQTQQKAPRLNLAVKV